MLEINIDDSTVKEMLQKAIDEKVKEVSQEQYFFTMKQLEKYTGVSRPTIMNRFLKNGMKYYRVGDRYLFKRCEVDSFLDEMTESMDATDNNILFFNGLKRGEGI